MRQSQIRFECVHRVAGAGLRRVAPGVGVAVAVAIAGLSSPVPAVAQSGTSSSGTSTIGAPKIQEIVVTAQRRKQNLQDVPISISAFTQNKMNVQGIRGIEDIAKYTPGLNYSSGSMFAPMGANISIRGVSSTVGGATTGIYLNDTPIQVRSTRPTGSYANTVYPLLFDLERVEVLRGPQGTLFGSGSEGGTVRFITPEPSLTDTSLYLRTGGSATKSGGPSYEFGVSGGTPLVSGKLGMRGSFAYRHTGGYIDKGSYYSGEVTQKNYNFMNGWSARLAFKWAPTDRITITPAYYHQHKRAQGDPSFYLTNDFVAPDKQVFSADYQPPVDLIDGVGEGRYVNIGQLSTWGDQDWDLYSLKVEYSVHNMNLIYNTSLYKRDQLALADYGPLDYGLKTLFAGRMIVFPKDPTVQSRGYQSQRNRYFTQELRLQSDEGKRFDWTVGLFVQQQNIHDLKRIHNPRIYQVFDTYGLPNHTFKNGSSGIYKGLYSNWRNVEVDNDQKALYGQVNIHATKHLIVTVGDRYSKMHFGYSSLAAGGVNGANPRIDNGGSNVDANTPKVSLKWTTDGGKMVYLTAAKGTRNSGWNPPEDNAICRAVLEKKWHMKEIPQQYSPDQVWSYELGTKFQALDSRLAVDASIFDIEWKDIIRNVAIGSPCSDSFTTNLGKATSRGIDFSIRYRPIDDLMLAWTTGHAKVRSRSTIYVTDADGNIVMAPNSLGELAPEYITRDGAVLPGSHTTVSLAAQFSFTAFNNPSYLRVDWHWNSSPDKGDRWDPSSTQYAGYKNLFAIPTSHTANVRVGTTLNGWNVSLFVKNITNQQPLFISRGIATSAVLTAATIRPREIGLNMVLRH